MGMLDVGESVAPSALSRPRCPQEQADSYRKSYRILTIGLYRKVPVPNPGSRAAKCPCRRRKVPVDNLLIYRSARQSGRVQPLQSARASTLPNHDRRASLDRRGAVRERQPSMVQLHPCPAILAHNHVERPAEHRAEMN